VVQKTASPRVADTLPRADCSNCPRKMRQDQSGRRLEVSDYSVYEMPTAGKTDLMAIARRCVGRFT